MQVQSFAFTFSLEGRTIPANCSVFDVVRHFDAPMYRVAFKAGKRDHVFILYKVDAEEQMFFWYPGVQQRAARSIATGLEQYLAT